jgi:hypothetical protein
MAIGPCRPGLAWRRASMDHRAYAGLVPGHRPKARPVGRLVVPCRPLGMAFSTVSGRPTARQAKKTPKISQHFKKNYTTTLTFSTDQHFHSHFQLINFFIHIHIQT